MKQLAETMDSIRKNHRLEREFSLVTYKSSISDHAKWSFDERLIRERTGTVFGCKHLNQLKGVSFIADAVGVFAIIDNRLALVFETNALENFCFIETDIEERARSFIFGMKLNRHIIPNIEDLNYTSQLAGILFNCRQLQKTKRLRGIWVPLGGFCAEF